MSQFPAWVPVVAIVLAAINVAVFFLYAADKAKAKRGAWRIRESTLLGAAACFGALGAFVAMRVFRHKTQHRQFVIGVPVLLIVQVAFLAAAFIYLR